MPSGYPTQFGRVAVNLLNPLLAYLLNRHRQISLSECWQSTKSCLQSSTEIVDMYFDWLRHKHQMLNHWSSR